MSNYGSKKELDGAAGVNTYNLAAKKDFISFKAEVDKLSINKLTNDLSSFNNLKTKVDN